MLAESSLDVASYIASLPAPTKAAVLASPFTAQSLFRGLPPLAKQYILRLLYVDAPVSLEAMALWVRAGAESQHKQTVGQLELLSVLVVDRQGGVQLNTDFKHCLRAALAGRGVSTDDGGQQLSLSPAIMRQVAAQAAKHWQSVLLYILDSEEQLVLPEGMTDDSLSIQDLLLSAGLVVSQGYRHELTPAGLSYLLKSTSEQVWILLRQYIKAAEQASGKELASTLSFLMQLSFRRVWQPSPLAALAPREQTIASHMAQLGLVATYQQDGRTYFCATPLAASLCGGSSGGDGAAAAAAAADGGGPPGSAAGSRAGPGGSLGGSSSLDSEAYIIVETNFRVYAHTSSHLQRALLSRLMRTDCLLPNLYVGTLTRETFMAALDAGLSAAAVTRFLQQHAHPQVARRVPSVPENVQEQLVLWESETRRVQWEAATLYAQFEDDDLFAAASNHAQGMGELLWVSHAARMFAVRRAGHEAMRNFIVEFKAQRARHQAAAT